MLVEALTFSFFYVTYLFIYFLFFIHDSAFKQISTHKKILSLIDAQVDELFCSKQYMKDASHIFLEA